MHREAFIRLSTNPTTDKNYNTVLVHKSEVISETTDKFRVPLQVSSPKYLAKLVDELQSIFDISCKRTTAFNWRKNLLAYIKFIEINIAIW